MSWNRVTLGPVALLLLLGAVGCAPRTVAERFGQSQPAARDRQVQNPEASENRNPVDGLGATTVVDVLDNYHTNQKTEAQVERQERQRDGGLNDLD